MKARHDGPSPQRRRDAVCPQDVSHRGPRDLKPELPELADDPPMTPAGVLPREAHDQRDEVRGERWPSAAPGVEGPAALDHPPMPAKQRLRSDGERRPASAGERPRQRREQRPIACPVARAPSLPS
jgi:hypothetical protein